MDTTTPFERSDTDGFVSQWATDITARQERAEADLVEAGGVAEFEALFDLDGNPVPAKKIDAKYGPCWAILDGWDWDHSAYTGEFVSCAKQQSTYERKGYRVGKVMAPAKVILAGGGRGIAGAASLYVAVIQTGFAAGRADR